MSGSADISIQNRVILFTDLHDYSVVAKILGDKSYEFLQEMYERLGDLIVEYRGEIIKYLGDAMLCVFPAGSEKQVVECSLKIRKAYADLVERRGIPHETELEIGLSAGPVAMGTFGHQSLRMRDIFGEEITRAAVIGHHRGIAMTENVYHKIKDEYKTERLPDLTVKWQTEPLKVWEIAQ